MKRSRAQQQQQAAQVQAASAAATKGGISPDLSLWGYGEIYYTHPDPRLQPDRV